MKRIILILLVGVLAFSCRSKKIIYNKKPKTETSVKVEREIKQSVKVVEEKVEKVISTNNYASDTERYIDMYKDIAQKEMVIYNIPASITLAQGILESGSGKARLAVQANNHFGIKCHDWDGERIYHDDDASQECFRKYEHAKSSFRDHSLFLKNRSRYSNLFDLKQDDYKAWAKGLKAAGYATDVRYPQKLIDLIERYNLHEFDKANETGFTIKRQLPVKTKGEYYTVSKGDTLYSISRKFNLTVAALQKLNGLKDNNLSIGQKLLVK